jgi:membrane protein DedA with SNARE-associated domain
VRLEASADSTVSLRTLARLTQHLISYGLPLLFALIAVESAGVPLPGETALVTAAILATPSQRHYALWEVIAVAATAAIVGDNVGYWIGRTGGRAILDRYGPVRRYAARVLPPAERFFARHGSKTVFVGRFIAFLRVTSAWLAGISRMPWWRFLVWNAAGGIAWATLVGVVAYEFGRAAADAISRYGLYAVGLLVVAGVAGIVALRWWHRRLEKAGGRA